MSGEKAAIFPEMRYLKPYAGYDAAYLFFTRPIRELV